jgi:hypothetical protein
MLNMQEKTDEKAIRESDQFNELYAKVTNWNDGDVRHGRVTFREPFKIPEEEIGEKMEKFILKKDWGPVNIFLDIIGTPNKSKSSSKKLDRLLRSTNNYI